MNSKKTAPKGFVVFRFFLFQKLIFLRLLLRCLLCLLHRPPHRQPHRVIRIFLNLQPLTPLPSIRTIQLPLFFRFLPMATLEHKKSFLSSYNSLKAAMFHTMAFKLSLESNSYKFTPSTKIAFLKVLYNVCRIKKKVISFEQYSRIRMGVPKIAICETTSDSVFVINTSFTSRDAVFHHALADACDEFDATMLGFVTPKN